MPITFEQPDPMGYSPLAGVPGQVAQGNLDRTYLMQMQEMGLQAGARNAALQSQAAIANARMGQENAQRSTQAAIAGQAGNVSMAQIYGQNAQQAMQSQRIAASQAQQAQQFTYQDSVRLNQMRNAMSSIDNDSTLTDEEKANYRMQLQTGIDPMVQRQQAAKTTLMQQQVQDWQQTEAMKAAGIKTYQQHMADNPTGVKDLGNGTLVAYKPDGTPVFHKAEQQQQGMDLKDQLSVMKEWRASRNDVVKMLSTKDDLGNLQKPKDEDVDAMMGKLGHGKSLDDELRMYQSGTRKPVAPPPVNDADFGASFNMPAIQAEQDKGNLAPLNAFYGLTALRKQYPTDAAINAAIQQNPQVGAQLQSYLNTIKDYKLEGGKTQETERENWNRQILQSRQQVLDRAEAARRQQAQQTPFGQGLLTGFRTNELVPRVRQYLHEHLMESGPEGYHPAF